MAPETFDTASDGSMPLTSPAALFFSALIGLFLVVSYQWLIRAPNIPTINAYPGDWMLKKAHERFEQNARALIREGTEKFKGPFRIITSLSSTVVIPSEWAEWVKNCKDLDHLTFVSDEFFAGYPGWEGVTALVHDPYKLLIEVTKTKFNQNSQCQTFRDQITRALADTWTDNPDWHDTNWHANALTFTSHMSSAVFAGPALAANPEWQDLTTTYATNMFLATRALRAYPRFTRSLAARFLPEARACREQVRRGRALLAAEVERRAAQGGEHADALAWVEDKAAGRGYDAVAMQLGFAMAGLHTTTQLLKQVVLDICGQTGLVEAVREEVEAAVRESGWTTAGLFGMRLLDSVVKETLRLKPGTLTNLERKALADITLPDGTKIAKGTNVSVDSSRMWDPAVYGDDADRFDGYRFLRLREEGAAAAALVSTGPDMFAFGMGKSLCPGRFFVNNQIKVALASMLLEYDVRLAEGYTPKYVEFGFEIMADFEPRVEVRKRGV